MDVENGSEQKKIKSTKLLVELQYLMLAHVIFNLVVMLIWVFTVVLFLQNLIDMPAAINPFELSLYTFNSIYLIYLLVQMHRRGLHVLSRNQIYTCLETVVLCIAVLIIYYALRLGVETSANHLLYYLSSEGRIKQIEIQLLEIVIVFPAFFCTYLIIILYQGLKVYQGIIDVNYQLKEGASLNEVLKAEHSIAEADKY